MQQSSQNLIIDLGFFFSVHIHTHVPNTIESSTKRNGTYMHKSILWL